MYKNLKSIVLSHLFEKIDFMGLDSNQLLRDSNCFGLMYGASVCQRCTHKVKIGTKLYPLNQLCKVIQAALVERVDKHQTEVITETLRNVKNLIKLSKIKAKTPKKVLGVGNKTKQIDLTLKAVKRYAKRQHNELDWAIKIKEISTRYGMPQLEIVDTMSEVIKKSCDVKTLRDLVRLTQ